ncbi:MAG: NAD(P)-dependent oxidoreductase, partial [Deltaproteobacteria bacterium]|nr:NAD(P)-dependent oxidoreductase [Deltaproteobacteria bacterium]
SDAVSLANRLGGAARRAGISRVVVVSSLAATGPCAQSPGVSDDTLPAPVSAYGWSKYMAELAFAREFTRPAGLVVLRPPIIYGPGDRGLLPCFKAAKLGLIATPGGTFPVSAVHVRDAVQGVLCCLKPEARGVYHINDGAEHSMASLGLAMAAALGRKALVLRMPRPVLAASAALADFAAGLGLPPASWNRDKYRESRAEGWLCSAARITSELGYTPSMPLREGMADAVAGYGKLGWL